MEPPRRTLAEWKTVVENRLGSLSTHDANHSDTPLREDVDRGNQTVFPDRTRDVAIATVVSTADLARLFPVPDSATLMRSTLASLRRAEKEASEVLKVVQRDLAYQLQEAGVSYDRSSFDDLRSMGRFDDGGGRAVTERKQLRFKSTKNPLLAASLAASRPAAPAGGAGYWNFATHHSDLQLYDKAAIKRAAAMDAFATEVEVRHKAFDEGEKQLIHELQASRQLLALQLDLNSDSAMPSRYNR